MTKHIANIITGCRIVGSILLLLLPVLSPGFYIIYILCGISDMIDGTVARKTNSTSKFGSQLDSIADIIFVMVSMLKWIPVIRFPTWLWIWVGVIGTIRILNIIWGYATKKQFITMHTVMNKVTGLLLFLCPRALSIAQFVYIAIPVCTVATISAIQEWVYIIAAPRPSK